MIINNNTKSFGYLFCVIFVLFGFYPLINNETVNYFIITVGIIFGILGFRNSKILLPLKKLWIKFGELIGKFISPIILFLIYFVIIYPTKIVLIIFKKDILRLNYKKHINTYWIDKKDQKLQSMNNQF
tara:strand:- start:168 stop:551 length:384 start_codon:yes stop_codon:yes gene_type:complete